VYDANANADDIVDSKFQGWKGVKVYCQFEVGGQRHCVRCRIGVNCSE
jgi:hypothetical protein